MKESFLALSIAGVYILIINIYAIPAGNENAHMMAIGLVAAVVSFCIWYALSELNSSFNRQSYWLFQNLTICITSLWLTLTSPEMLPVAVSGWIISITFVVFIVLFGLYLKRSTLTLACGGNNE